MLAGGADVAYPRSQARAARPDPRPAARSSRSCRPGFAPRRWCFPARNRIIAALASATIVVEAAERSGSLITAELAQDLGRDVGAVPGRRWTGAARGANALLRDGATVVRDAATRSTSRSGVGHGLGTDADARTAGLDPALRALLGRVREGATRSTRSPLTPAEADAALAASRSSSCSGW